MRMRFERSREKGRKRVLENALTAGGSDGKVTHVVPDKSLDRQRELRYDSTLRSEDAALILDK
jgi:hypothetical protein